MSGQEDEVEGDHPPEWRGLMEEPLILEIVTEKEMTMSDEEGGMRNTPNEKRNWQKSIKQMSSNTEKVGRTKSGSPEPYGKP